MHVLGQVLISLDCAMNIIIAIQTAKGFSGANQVVHTTPKA